MEICVFCGSERTLPDEQEIDKMAVTRMQNLFVMFAVLLQGEVLGKIL